MTRISWTGLAALAGLCWFVMTVDEFQLLVYQGGFAAVAVLSAVVIAAVARAGSWLGHLLGIAPLRYLGLRSYSLYLWHWPVFMLSRPQLDVPLDGPLSLVVRLAVTLALAELSYRWIEQPIRTGALERHWRAWRARTSAPRRRPDLRGSVAIGSGAVWVVALAFALVLAHQPAPSLALAEDAAQPMLLEATAPPPTPTLAPTQTPRALHVTAVGDSVMLGAAPELRASIDGIKVDTVVGRQIGAAIQVLQAHHKAGQLGDVVVIHIGNNNNLTAKQFVELMEVVSGVPRVIVVNLKVPRRWEQPNNALIAKQVAKYNNAVLLDWHTASVKHGELFGKDGIHLRPKGARRYAELIAASIQQ